VINLTVTQLEHPASLEAGSFRAEGKPDTGPHILPLEYFQPRQDRVPDRSASTSSGDAIGESYATTMGSDSYVFG